MCRTVRGIGSFAHMQVHKVSLQVSNTAHCLFQMSSLQHITTCTSGGSGLTWAPWRRTPRTWWRQSSGSLGCRTQRPVCLSSGLSFTRWVLSSPPTLQHHSISFEVNLHPLIQIPELLACKLELFSNLVHFLGRFLATVFYLNPNYFIFYVINARNS